MGMKITRKQTSQAFWWFVCILQSLALGYLILSTVNFADKEWTIFLRAKIPLIWTQLVPLFLALLVFDAITPGHTISTITSVDRSSSGEDKRTAAYFLIGVLIASAMAVRGGF
jgi:hypothetical protein